MNMISTGAFLNEMDASGKQDTLLKKLVAAWEKKNAKVARAGGVSLMALSLAACGSSDDDDSSSSSSSDTTTTTTTTSQAFSLTSGIDTVTGGTGNDTINAGLNSNGSQTLQSLDTIDGGAGTDTLNVVLGTAGTVSPQLTSIETVKITSTANVTVDLLGASSVTSVSSIGSSGTVDINNIASTSASVLIQSTDQNHTVDFLNSAVTGTADSATVTLSNVTGGTLTVDAAIEDVTFVSNGGANTTGTTTTSANTVTVTGAENLTLGGTLSKAETIDASAATGKFTVTTDNTNNTTVKGGSAADTVTVTGSQSDIYG